MGAEEARAAANPQQQQQAAADKDDDDDLMIIGATGTVATRDLPHARCHCGVNIFEPTPTALSHVKTCDNCFCYVCDVPAKDCEAWGDGSSATDHCHALDKSPVWQARRTAIRAAATAAEAARAAAAAPMPFSPAPATVFNPSIFPGGSPTIDPSALATATYDRTLPDPAGVANLVLLGSLKFEVRMEDRLGYHARQTSSSAPKTIAELAARLAPYGFRYGLGVPHKWRGQRPRRKTSKLDIHDLSGYVRLERAMGLPESDRPDVEVASEKEMLLYVQDADGAIRKEIFSVPTKGTSLMSLRKAAAKAVGNVEPGKCLLLLSERGYDGGGSHWLQLESRAMTITPSHYSSKTTDLGTMVRFRAFVLPSAHVAPSGLPVNVIEVAVLVRTKKIAYSESTYQACSDLRKSTGKTIVSGSSSGMAKTEDQCEQWLFEVVGCTLVLPKPSGSLSLEEAAKEIHKAACKTLSKAGASEQDLRKASRLYQSSSYGTEPIAFFSRERKSSAYASYGSWHQSTYGYDDWGNPTNKPGAGNKPKPPAEDWHRKRNKAIIIFEEYEGVSAPKVGTLPVPTSAIVVKEMEESCPKANAVLKAHKVQVRAAAASGRRETEARRIFEDLQWTQKASSRLEEQQSASLVYRQVFRTAMRLEPRAAPTDAATDMANKYGTLTVDVYAPVQGKAHLAKPVMRELFIEQSPTATWALTRIKSHRGQVKTNKEYAEIDKVVRAVMLAGPQGTELKKLEREYKSVKTPEEAKKARERAEKKKKAAAVAGEGGGGAGGSGAGGSGAGGSTAAADEDDDLSDSDDGRYSYNDYTSVSLKDFVEMLNASERPAAPQPKGLREGLTMRNYQLQTLQWMLEKERQQGGLRALSWREVSLPGGRKAFYSPTMRVLADRVPACPRGGFLAESMGMGKTVISLALILSNPPPALPPPDLDAPTAPYSLENPAKSVATLVVCAVSLVGQWIDEAKSKLADDSELRVYMYHGQGRIRDVNTLVESYDLVVTTYQTLGTDYGKTKKPAWKAKDHPLGCIRWHRIVLDESHTVKMPTVQQSKACAALHGNLRWCASGTPVNNSIEDLFGQMIFLRAHPLDTKNGFELAIKKHFQTNGAINSKEAREIAALLKRCMIRHTQHQTMGGHQLLELPKKTEVSVAVELSKEERAKYDELHAQVLKQYQAIRACGPMAVQKNLWQIMSYLLPLRRLCSGGTLTSKDLVAREHTGGGGRRSGGSGGSGGAQQQTQEGQGQQGRDVKPDVKPTVGAAQTSTRRGGSYGAGGAGGASMDVKPVPFPPVASECSLCGDLLDEPARTPCCQTWFCIECVSAALNKSSPSKCPSCKKPCSTTSLQLPSGSPDKPKKKTAPAKKKAKKKEGPWDDGGSGADEVMNEVEDAPPPFTSESKVKALIKELKAMHADDECNKALIFSQYQSTLSWLQQKLVEAGFDYCSITGSMALKQRDKAIQKFQKDPPTTVFLLSMRSGAVGINLTGANYVFLVEPCLNPALEAQAVGRAWRMGQQREVQVKRLYIKDSVEDQIRTVVEKRGKSVVAPAEELGRGHGKGKGKAKAGADLAGNLKSDRAALRTEELDILFAIDEKKPQQPQQSMGGQALGSSACTPS